MCFDGDDPKVFTESQPRARKAYYCDECWQVIAVGEKHHYFSGLWDGGWDSFRICLTCQEARCLMADLETIGGCYGPEAYPPFGRLDEACSEYDRETRDALGLWADLGGRRVKKAEVIRAFTRAAPKLIEEAKARQAEERQRRKKASQQWPVMKV